MPGPYDRGSQVALVADTQKQQRLDGERQEKVFEQAMIESPMVAFMKHSLLQSFSVSLDRVTSLYWTLPICN